MRMLPRNAILIVQALPDIILGETLFEKQHLGDCDSPFLIIYLERICYNENYHPQRNSQ